MQILFRKRIVKKCNVCLSAGGLSINDNDDNDDTGGTSVWLSVILFLLRFGKVNSFLGYKM